MKRLLWTYCRFFGSLGFLLGFALGFLYGIGGFFHDFILTEINQGTYLALNALWAMPMIFCLLGLGVGFLLSFLLWGSKKIKR